MRSGTAVSSGLTLVPVTGHTAVQCNQSDAVSSDYDQAQAGCEGWRSGCLMVLQGSLHYLTFLERFIAADSLVMPPCAVQVSSSALEYQLSWRPTQAHLPHQMMKPPFQSLPLQPTPRWSSAS
jgi:hypothetical protein